MSNYTATITVDQTPAEPFAAFTNIRGWWNETIHGVTDQLGAEFYFNVPDVHRCTMKLTELVPGKRVVWSVSDSYVSFAADSAEWDGTEVVFDIAENDGKTEVRFTHVGLVPAFECYELCSNAWGGYVTSSLRNLITTGTGEPITASDTFDSEVRKHLDARVNG